MMKRESAVIRRAQTPAPSSHSDKHCHQVSQSEIAGHKHVSVYDMFPFKMKESIVISQVRWNVCQCELCLDINAYYSPSM